MLVPTHHDVQVIYTLKQSKPYTIFIFEFYRFSFCSLLYLELTLVRLAIAQTAQSWHSGVSVTGSRRMIGSKER